MTVNHKHKWFATHAAYLEIDYESFVIVRFACVEADSECEESQMIVERFEEL